MKLRYLIAVFATLVGLLGCKKETTNTTTQPVPQPTPDAVAMFTYTLTNNGIAPCKGTFVNQSTNAQSVTWFVPNGAPLTDSIITLDFKTEGNYNISLTATGKNQKSNTKTQAVNIGAPPKYIEVSKIELYDIPKLKTGGIPWDADGSGPDMYVNISTITPQVSFNTPVLNNWDLNLIPTWNLATPIKLALDNTWFILVYDEDLISDETMSGFTFDPVDYIAKNGYKDGVIDIKDGWQSILQGKFTIKFVN